ncbi:MAG: hypothetical protein FWG84_04015 [Bacteroidales bacterium]|nr:hypothetical protein [Bacteroidales bacterium]
MFSFNKNLKRNCRNEKVAAELEEQSQDGFPKVLTSKRLIGGRQQKIFLSICALIFIGVSGLVFYSCNKEKPVEELLPNPNPKSSTAVVDDQLIREAHNIMVDFLLKSKNALDNNSVNFEKICRDGDGETLMQFIGYSATEADRIGRRLMDICTKINESNGIEPNTNSDFCSSCNLKSFPIFLSELNGGVITAPVIDWEALALCFFDCSVVCLEFFYCAPCYAVCVLACTAGCYYVATS